MMKIKIHRGLDQIGGCITEIWTESSRVFIDFGQNLPGNGKPTTSEEDALMVADIVENNEKEHQAVFYTHAHEDHVGLFPYIPFDQFISEGGKDLLLIKYKTLLEGNEMAREKCGQHRVPDRSEEKRLVECCRRTKTLIDKLETFRTWKRTGRGDYPKPIMVGNIRITPFFCCHSIYDAHMFLIEAEGQRFWHTGDYRGHGYMSKGQFLMLRKYATNIDVLITEGTMLSREDKAISEYRVSMEMIDVMQAFKYVFVLASATDIERLGSINHATKKTKKPLCIMSLFMKRTMELFTEREGNLGRGLFSFSPLFYTDRLYSKLRDKGFTMVVGPSQGDKVKPLLNRLPQEETILIYSSWNGYYMREEQVRANAKYKEFREMFHNVVDIHTSGHVDRDAIKKVIGMMHPKEVICIHKEADARL